ncbi:Gfo/Idh/MocA family oxidoreductase [Calothrix sp. UHCC 0171]|uniref:Gfo/Idh/MocA family protein n=1 Tax=Calothrix sp. UHCC 0171 TaxID=3110245 RepID=UPI002B215106|nr:Gfo/Idh/MocA family oxidoreductase [Calothrix sp. UHCC 0171]MEA5569781.1 Gfo/Idh/MocA family oxidoreductase [Calothrix sp. UHCC 0171]
MYNSSVSVTKAVINVGLIGTGYAAKLRAESLLPDSRVRLVVVAGHDLERVQTFAKEYEAEAINSWQQICDRDDIDLVFISTMNSEHSKIVRAAITSGKHVVVEYPLAFDTQEAGELIALAKQHNKLLHVEHIELLGGVHQAIKQYLPEVGQVFYVRYNTIKPQLPAPRKWSYNHNFFGFPLIGALSRLHRLTDLFGEVLTVNCHHRFWQVEDNYYQSCFCIAQLSFASGLLGQIIYGKGETLWQPERKFEIHGEKGGLIFNEEKGILVRAGEKIPLDVASRSGLFAKDTSMVLEHLLNGMPLYVQPEASLYTLKVAEAAKRSADTGLTMIVD